MVILFHQNNFRLGKIAVFLISLLLVSCGLIPIQDYNFDVILDIAVYNKNGEDLLDTNLTNSFKDFEILFEYDQIPGQKLHGGIPIFNSPRFSHNENRNIISILGTDILQKGMPEISKVKISWPDGTADKFTFIFKDSKNLGIVTEILVNDISEWELTSKKPRLILLHKE